MGQHRKAPSKPLVCAVQTRTKQWGLHAGEERWINICYALVCKLLDRDVYYVPPPTTHIVAFFDGFFSGYAHPIRDLARTSSNTQSCNMSRHEEESKEKRTARWARTCSLHPVGANTGSATGNITGAGVIVLGCQTPLALVRFELHGSKKKAFLLLCSSPRSLQCNSPLALGAEQHDNIHIWRQSCAPFSGTPFLDVLRVCSHRSRFVMCNHYRVVVEVQLR
jgi:hypothetical protein